MRPLLLLACVPLTAVVVACGDDDEDRGDPRVSLIGSVSENATYAWEAAGPEGLYDYLSTDVQENCTQEEVADALADDPQPTGWRRTFGFAFEGEGRATADVTLITADGDEEQAWEFVEETAGTWRISRLPGLQACAS